ncbi:beta-glucosidase [Pricia antarctica]|uniref:beta-N-acetylhexosaminidase n=2 Tax=Pricia antarctica TaxID=641691 RepID=A0A1G7FGK6_9FLAO|nr:beta-glucosidase [Pricia antarctica]
MRNIISCTQSNKQLTLREKVGQLFMPSAFINDTEEEIQKLEKLISNQDVGSLCFFHSRASAATNFEGVKAVVHNENSYETLKSLIKRYQKAAKYPLLIAIDAEWGLAMRIENTPQYPYAITLGALADDQSDLIYKVAENIAKDCRAAGIHWNLSPCVDINNNPDNPVIGYRSFGADKNKVTEKALAFIKGTQSAGILTSIKHFPGHGDTATDSHLTLPLIDKSKEELFENELYPFQKLIDEGVDSVMVGHLSVRALSGGKIQSSSLSKKIIKGILREHMGYKGVVISDALNMHAVAKNHPLKGELEWLAFDAGNDVLCFAEHIAEGIETILKNASQEQIEESFERVWKLKVHTQVSSSSSSSSSRPSSSSSSSLTSNSNLISPNTLNRKIAVESLTLYKGSAKLISDFRETDFLGACFPEKMDNQFFKNINPNIAFKSISSFDGVLKERANILLALFPPQVKPTHKFGFAKEELIFINELIQTKNVVLYLFGNPYVLNHINYEKTKAVVIAYQNFEVFQEIAAEHFMGNLEAKGKLSVKIRA